MYVLIALAIALVCVLLGFIWGRTNVKSKIEDALEKERMALASREFAVRQQLDETIAELARLRPLADELARVQERLKQEQSRYAQMRAEFNTSFSPSVDEFAESPSSPQAPVPPPPPESADIAIQKLLQSLEENLTEPGEAPVAHEQIESNEPPPVPIIEREPALPVEREPALPVIETIQAVEEETPAFAPIAEQKPVERQPIESRPILPQPVAKKPAASQSSGAQAAADEWQEFARSLATLTGRKQ